MTLSSEQPPNQGQPCQRSEAVPGIRDHAGVPGPLPPDLRGADARLHARLLEWARAGRSGAPPGLADRVFAASVRDLPARPSIPFPARRHAAWWPSPRVVAGRLALAAALGLAFVVAARFYRTPAPVEAPAVIADIGWLAEEPLAEIDGAVAHLLDTGALSSFEELTPELKSLLEM